VKGGPTTRIYVTPELLALLRASVQPNEGRVAYVEGSKTAVVSIMLLDRLKVEYVRPPLKGKT